MPLIMPEVDDTALINSPLAVVICQIRYEQNLVVSDGDTGLKIHEQLGGREGSYPLIEPMQTAMAQIEISGSGLAPLASSSLSSRGWRFKSKDGEWQISILPDSISIETTAYTTWRGDFRDRLVDLLRAVAENVKPSIEERLGLRYVNRIPSDGRSRAKHWRDVISADLLGPLASDFWVDGIDAYQQQFDLDIDGGARCLLRTGFTSNQAGEIDGYLLDYDVFRQMPQRFDTKVIADAADGFNRAALALFHKSLQPTFLAQLRGR